MLNLERAIRQQLGLKLYMASYMRVQFCPGVLKQEETYGALISHAHVVPTQESLILNYQQSLTLCYVQVFPVMTKIHMVNNPHGQ